VLRPPAAGGARDGHGAPVTVMVLPVGLGPGDDADRTDRDLSQWNYHTRLMYRNQLCLTTLIMVMKLSLIMWYRPRRFKLAGRRGDASGDTWVERPGMIKPEVRLRVTASDLPVAGGDPNHDRRRWAIEHWQLVASHRDRPAWGTGAVSKKILFMNFNESK
jgi:hypothetical protein